MPQITEEQGRKILEKEGYKVEKFLGSGSASIVFKCSDSAGRLVAVKLCALDKSDAITHHDGSEATLESEIKASEELRTMGKEFTAKTKTIADLNKRAEMQKYYNGFFKYAVKPIYIKSVPLDDGSGAQCGIFEAELADGTVLDDIYATRQKLDSGKMIPQTDYKFLKKTARGCLKCLQNIHESGRVHGDVATRNILTMKNAKGKKISATLKYCQDVVEKLDDLVDRQAFIALANGMSANIMDLGGALFTVWATSVGCSWDDYCLEKRSATLASNFFTAGELPVSFVMEHTSQDRYRWVKRPNKPPKPKFLILADEDLDILKFCLFLMNTSNTPTARYALGHDWLKK